MCVWEWERTVCDGSVGVREDNKHGDKSVTITYSCVELHAWKSLCTRAFIIPVHSLFMSCIYSLLVSVDIFSFGLRVTVCDRV